jgi:hypothetical protein
VSAACSVLLILTRSTQFRTPPRFTGSVAAEDSDNDAASNDEDDAGRVANDGDVNDADDPENEPGVGVGGEVSANIELRIQQCRDALRDNSSNLKAFIRRENKECMHAHKMIRPTKATTELCKQWLHLHIVRLTKQLSVRFKTRLTARDRVMTIIRMLTILHHVRDYY